MSFRPGKRTQISIEFIVLLSGLMVLATMAYFAFKYVILSEEPHTNSTLNKTISTIKSWANET